MVKAIVNIVVANLRLTAFEIVRVFCTKAATTLLVFSGHSDSKYCSGHVRKAGEEYFYSAHNVSSVNSNAAYVHDVNNHASLVCKYVTLHNFVRNSGVYNFQGV